MKRLLTTTAAALLLLAAPAAAQEPVQWGEQLEFHTFSIVAIDPAAARDHDDAIWADPAGEGR